MPCVDPVLEALARHPTNEPVAEGCLDVIRHLAADRELSVRPFHARQRLVVFIWWLASAAPKTEEHLTHVPSTTGMGGGRGPPVLRSLLKDPDCVDGGRAGVVVSMQYPHLAHRISRGLMSLVHV